MEKLSVQELNEITGRITAAFAEMDTSVQQAAHALRAFGEAARLADPKNKATARLRWQLRNKRRSGWKHFFK